jgi:hypothetical protein
MRLIINVSSKGNFIFFVIARQQNLQSTDATHLCDEPLTNTIHLQTFRFFSLCPSGVFASDTTNSKETFRKTPMQKRVSIIIQPYSVLGIF